MHERVNNDYGVSEETDAPPTRTPTELSEVLSVTDEELDVAIAKVVRGHQLRADVREENGMVPVEAVDEELRRLFADVDADPPSYDELATIRKRSRFLDTTVDIDADELVIRLTEAGEDVAAPDTGSVQAAGSSKHDDALLEIEAELTSLGFTVSICSQDGSEQPDARATHPDLDERFAIEVETTTPENPAKVLTNLRKAQEAEEVPLFVVRPGEAETDWAKRVEGILTPPVREFHSGETRFYTTDSNITFNGGATEEGGVTAVRPVSGTDDSSRTVWMREDDSIVLSDGTGTQYLRVSSFSAVTKDRVPAIYSYDHDAEEYVVYEQGEQHVYDSKDAFEADWVRIKKPFIPEDELPTPEYSRDSYVIVILADDDPSVVYADGTTKPLETLLDHLALHNRSERDSESDGEYSESSGDSHLDESAADGDPTGKDSPERIAQADAGEHDREADDFESFVDVYVAEDEGAVLPKDDLYNVYRIWAIRHDQEIQSKSWFSRSLGEFVTYDTSRVRRNGTRVNCYTGIALTAAGQQLLE
jgi:hypothetical protein